MQIIEIVQQLVNEKGKDVKVSFGWWASLMVCVMIFLVSIMQMDSLKARILRNKFLPKGGQQSLIATTSKS